MNRKNKSKASRDDRLTIVLLLVAYAAVMLANSAGLINSHMNGMLVPLCVYATMAVSLNLVVGILGELSLGHAGFMCLGAFASAFFSKLFENTMGVFPRFLIAILIGGLVAGIFGFLIGIPVLRLNGDYLAIVTLAFGEIIKNVINVLYVGRDSAGLHFALDQSKLGMDKEAGELLIAGPQGITGTPNDASFTIGFAVLLISTILVLNLINSREGRAIMSIRDNRIAAGSVGIPITAYKMRAFTMSAVIAGFAGALYAHNLASLIATPARFGYNMSIMFLVFVVLGGIGSTRGAIIAAVVLTLIPELLRFMNDYRMLIYSIVLIAMMIINWNPKSRAWIQSHLHRKKAAETAESDGREDA
ncbi:MAG: branched-chain amino acid ABC transporter permease [Lachnospiraceae bacterium]|nr:branched-chain amino acid ABC transporter permease [Lachnospiraceae bacterium]